MRRIQSESNVCFDPFLPLSPFDCAHIQNLWMRAPFTFGPVYLHKGSTKNAPVSALRACAHWHVMIYQKLACFSWKGTDLLFSLCVSGWVLEWPPATPLPPSLPASPLAEPARGAFSARCRQAASLCVLTSTCQELLAAPPPGGGDAGDINAHNAHISIISSFGALPGYARIHTLHPQRRRRRRHTPATRTPRAYSATTWRFGPNLTVSTCLPNIFLKFYVF